MTEKNLGGRPPRTPRYRPGDAIGAFLIEAVIGRVAAPTKWRANEEQWAYSVVCRHCGVDDKLIQSALRHHERNGRRLCLNCLAAPGASPRSHGAHWQLWHRPPSVPAGLWGWWQR